MDITNYQSANQIIKDFSSNLISAFSADMFSMAMGLMLLDQTGLSLSFGLSLIMMPLVNLVGLIPIGNLVDNWPHKPLLLGGILVRLVALLIYAGVINQFVGIQKIVPTLAFLAVNYTVQSVMTTTYNASIHELVNPAYVQRLSSLTQAATSFATIFSPIIATSFYSLLGFDTFIWFSVGANVVVLLILLSMKFHVRPRSQSKHSKTQWTLFKGGLKYIDSNQFLKYVMSGGVVLNLMAAVFNVGMPFMVVHQLHAGNVVLGVLNSMYALGVLIGNLIISWLPKFQHLAKTLAFAYMAFSMTILAFGFVMVPNISSLTLKIAGGGILLLSGMALAFLNTPMGIYIQQAVPTRLLGRVSATVMTINMASAPVGIVIYSLIFQVYPSWLNFLISGIILLIFTIILGRLMVAEENRRQVHSNVIENIKN